MTGANPSGAGGRNGGRLRRVSGDGGGRAANGADGADGLPDRLADGGGESEAGAAHGRRNPARDWRANPARLADGGESGGAVEPLTGRKRDAAHGRRNPAAHFRHGRTVAASDGGGVRFRPMSATACPRDIPESIPRTVARRTVERLPESARDWRANRKRARHGRTVAACSMVAD